MALLKRISKVVGFFGRAAGFIAVGFSARLVVRDPRRHRRFAIGAVSRTSAGVLRSFDIRVRAVNLPGPPPDGKAYFVVANHASDVDIPVLASVIPVVFLAATDVGESAFIGTLTRLGGIVPVERRHKGELREEVQKVRQVLKEGFDMAIFPEGGTSNGLSVRPFKSALFQGAIDAEAVLLPVCINYLSVGGEALTAANRDQVLYYGDMEFPAHLGRMLDAGTIEVECRFLTPVPLAKGDSRKAVSERARLAILEQHRSVC